MPNDDFIDLTDEELALIERHREHRAAADADMARWQAANGAASSHAPSTPVGGPAQQNVNPEVAMHEAYDRVVASGGKREDGVAAGIAELIAHGRDINPTGGAR
jgi:anti-sigma factor RsiW